MMNAAAAYKKNPRSNDSQASSNSSLSSSARKEENTGFEDWFDVFSSKSEKHHRLFKRKGPNYYTKMTEKLDTADDIFYTFNNYFSNVCPDILFVN